MEAVKELPRLRCESVAHDGAWPGNCSTSLWATSPTRTQFVVLTAKNFIAFDRRRELARLPASRHFGRIYRRA